MRGTIGLILAVVVYLILKDALSGVGGFLYFAIIIAIMLPIIYIVEGGGNKDSANEQIMRDANLQHEIDSRMRRYLDRKLKESESDNQDLKSEAMSAMDGEKKVLFLRPFLIDSSIKIENPRKDSFAGYFVPFYRMTRSDTVTCDDAIRYHLTGYGDLVAIGAAGDNVGASRVYVDDLNWKKYFQYLAKEAFLIVIVAGSRPGTLWEMKTIIEDPDLFTKTIFIVPPKYIEKFNSSLPEPERLLALLRETGISLPEKINPGDGFVLNRDGSIRSQAQLFSSGFGGYSIKGSSLKECAESARANRSH